jgi:hypothetical protein
MPSRTFGCKRERYNEIETMIKLPGSHATLTLSALATAVMLVALAGMAQDFDVLQSFPGGNYGIGPAGIVLSGNTLYGAASGQVNPGIIFSVGTDGTGFATNYQFQGTNGEFPNGLLLSGNTFFA